MKRAFDANVSRVKPTTQNQGLAKAAEKVIQEEKAGSSKGEAEPAAPLRLSTAEKMATDAVQKLVAHMKTRQHKKSAPSSKGEFSAAKAATVAAKAETQSPDSVIASDQTSVTPPSAVPLQALQAHPVAASPVPAVPIRAWLNETAPSRPAAVIPGDDALALGRERILKLQERLHASQPPAEVEEPWATAEAARAFVSNMQSKLQTVTEERDALSKALDFSRVELEAVRADLSNRTQAAAAAEALAHERNHLAQEILKELGAITEERDQALSRIAELKRLDEQQTLLLGEAEKALMLRDEQLLQAQEREAQHQREHQAQELELASMATRLSQSSAERDAVQAKLDKLQTEAALLRDSRGALLEIRKLVNSAKV